MNVHAAVAESLIRQLNNATAERDALAAELAEVRAQLEQAREAIRDFIENEEGHQTILGSRWYALAAAVAAPAAPERTL